jgi:hypothetical protein
MLTIADLDEMEREKKEKKIETPNKEKGAAKQKKWEAARKKKENANNGDVLGVNCLQME